MSKSTNRYGRVTLHAKSSIEANPNPTPWLQSQWDQLDRVSELMFGARYDRLNSAAKTKVHLVLKGDHELSDWRFKLEKSGILKPRFKATELSEGDREELLAIPARA